MRALVFIADAVIIYHKVFCRMILEYRAAFLCIKIPPQAKWLAGGRITPPFTRRDLHFNDTQSPPDEGELCIW
jgi:hypothetical protein